MRGKSGRGLGPPDTFRCTAACLTLVDNAAEAYKADIQEYLSKFKPGSKEEQHMVGLLRLEKMFE